MDLAASGMELGADVQALADGETSVSIIGCPFRTTYGGYISSLKSALERVTGARVKWVATNCGCGDPVEKARQFETLDSDYFETPETVFNFNIVGYSSNPIKRALKAPTRGVGNGLRAARYAERSRGADVIHLQQTLAAFGSDVAFRLLRRRVDAARVVTLHELDPEQTDFPERNAAYNLADALIVHDSLMKRKLVSLGVDEERVHVVCCGTDLEALEDGPRDGLVFYGGHNLNKGKGLDLLLEAYRLLKARSSSPAPRLRVHGHYGTPTREVLQAADRAGVADDIDWLNTLSMPEMAALYRRSQVCVLPFTGSFAGLPAGVAAANRLPIIATRFAGIPDHIGDLGVWIGGDDPVELADKLEQCLADEAMRSDYGLRLRAHAERSLSWDAVARRTWAVYQAARAHAAKRRP